MGIARYLNLIEIVLSIIAIIRDWLTQHPDTPKPAELLRTYLHDPDHIHTVEELVAELAQDEATIDLAAALSHKLKDLDNV